MLYISYQELIKLDCSFHIFLNLNLYDRGRAHLPRHPLHRSGKGNTQHHLSSRKTRPVQVKQLMVLPLDQAQLM